MAAYARKLTESPATIDASDIDALRARGLDDRAIVDLTCVVSYFAYANRIVLGLGAEIEPEETLGFPPEESR